MEPCTNSIIPEHLKTNGRPVLPEFYIGEELYRRVKPSITGGTYEQTKLYDLSHNRQGPIDTPLSTAEDVLINVNAASVEELVLKEHIAVLKIKELSQTLTHTYQKVIPHSGFHENGEKFDHVCLITLVHDIIPCNYAHCVFQIELNGELVSKENYKKTLGKDNRVFSLLRTLCKIEFEKMELYKIVAIDWANLANRQTDEFGNSTTDQTIC